MSRASHLHAAQLKPMLWGIGIFVLSLMFGWDIGMVGGLGLAGYKYYKKREYKQLVAQTQEVYDTEIAQPEYLAGKAGFPEKFYNYHDTYRLWKLISEGRALTLQEAYNLLENQLFIQEEMKALQQDIASSSRVSAVAGVVTAYNSGKILGKIK